MEGDRSKLCPDLALKQNIFSTVYTSHLFGQFDLIIQLIKHNF